MLGNLFYRGVSPTELESMAYHRLKYWDEWHRVMADAEKKAMEK